MSPTVESNKNDLYPDYPQGYYSNGAYTATPLPVSKSSQAYTNGGQQEDQDPQEAYYASLGVRFTGITEMLQSLPPRAAQDNTDVYYLDWTKPRFWRGKILNSTPSMVLLAQLTQESVICGLAVLEPLLTLARLRVKEGKIIGAWAWGLLGRCREVGQMGSEEVGVLRNLGKKALWLLRRISAGEVIGGVVDEPDVDTGEEDEDEGEGEGEEEGVGNGADPLDTEDADDGYSPDIDPIATAALDHSGNSEDHPIATMSDSDLAKAKQRILNSLGTDQAQVDFTETNACHEDGIQNPGPTYPVPELEVDGEGVLKEMADEKAMIYATLDMLVTIIGEFYGQRDLLDGRLLWDET